MFYRSGWLRCVGLISIGISGSVLSLMVGFVFRAGVDVRCYILLYTIIHIILYTYTYTYYYILYYYILYYTLIFFSSLPFLSQSISSHLPRQSFPILFFLFSPPLQFYSSPFPSPHLSSPNLSPLPSLPICL